MKQVDPINLKTEEEEAYLHLNNTVVNISLMSQNNNFIPGINWKRLGHTANTKQNSAKLCLKFDSQLIVSRNIDILDIFAIETS